MSPLLVTLGCLSLAADPPAPPPPSGPDIDRQAACPGPVVQPFQRLPKAGLVGPCREGGGGEGFSARTWVKEFDQPAHVPLPRFCPDGTPAPADGLLIYEGMRLTVDPNSGTYDVSFTATVPEMPVTLRLQLQFGWQPPDTRPPYTLTLPPIRLDPAASGQNREPGGNTFHVHHRGFSSLFLDGMPLFHDRTQFARVKVSKTLNLTPLTGFEVSRVGSARFGTGMPPPDDLRR